MDSTEWIIWILLFVFCLHKAFQAERFYQAVKSTGAYKNRVNGLSRVIAIRKGYREAKEAFIREQEKH